MRNCHNVRYGHGGTQRGIPAVLNLVCLALCSPPHQLKPPDHLCKDRLGIGLGPGIYEIRNAEIVDCIS